MPSDEGGGDYPLPRFPLPTATIAPLVWHSWDVEIQSGPGPQATVLDESGLVTATLDLYESGADLSAQPGTLLDSFDAEHPDVTSQDAATVRWDDSSRYPYIAKNMTARSAVSDPAPAGVFDLQLHPPNNGHYAVAAFVVPVAGRYVVSDFAARHILADAGESWAGLVLGNAPSAVLSDILTPTNDQLWESQLGTVDLGDLPANERICFGVYRSFDFDNFGDATELSFTLTAQSAL